MSGEQHAAHDTHSMALDVTRHMLRMIPDGAEALTEECVGS